MTHNPLISIPIFTYNGEKFLREQLDSIFAQTYKHIEVIACDDGSTDATKTILKEYETKYGLICHFNEVNLGVNKNVEKALSLCNGDFIAPSDQDDIWKPEKLQTLLEHIGENVLIYSTSIAVDQNGKVLTNYMGHTHKLIRGNNNKAFLFDNCVSGHTILFKRELLPFLIPLPKTVYPDWWIAFVASTYGTIEYYNKEYLVYYRRHNNQLTKTQIKVKHQLFQKLQYKEKQKKDEVMYKINILTDFKTLHILDVESQQLIEQLITELGKFPNVFYNQKLYALLNQYKKEVFAMSGEAEQTKLAKKYSRGLWYYRAKLYS
jgi:glycosyltransferase involved in cell wall biosynthesis